MIVTRNARARRKLARIGYRTVAVTEENGAVRLAGEVPTWHDRVRAGYAVAKMGYRGVLNDLRVPGVTESPASAPGFRDNLLEGQSFDVVVIGAGIIGCAVARELARFDLSIAVLEKENDVGVHASSRNDGMIHPGFAPTPGSKKAFYNVRGNRMYDTTSRDLDFSFRRPGSLTLFEKRWMRLLVPYMKYRCRKNGLDGDWRYVSAKRVRELEPNVTTAQHGGFLFPSAGVVNPFEVTIAYAENAAKNGVSFFFDTAVEALEIPGTPRPDRAPIGRIGTNRGTVTAKAVVNAAGVWADKIAELAGDRFFSIHPRRGVDAILDKRLAITQRHILSMPRIFGGNSTHSKGGGLIPCVEGNLLAGPTAIESPDREDYATSSGELDELRRLLSINRRLHAGDIITYFAGVRAATWTEDFVIERSERVPNLIHAAGIQSPGLASAPAIAEDVARMARDAVNEQRPVSPNRRFDPHRRGRIRPELLPLPERDAIIRRDSAYGKIVCRCEEVSEGEVRDALHSPIPVRSVDGIKRRTRAGAGRCHGGFCMPRVLEIIRQESGISLTEVRKKGAGSWIASSETKERWMHDQLTS